jgi:FAD dependent oxidoreductase
MRPETARRYDVTVVGGGLIGLATAYRLLEAKPGLRLAVLEKEPELARHQSGHNSGVIHAGLYYTPGSLKARLCREGWRDRLACDRHDDCREGDRRLRAVRGMRYSAVASRRRFPGLGGARASRHPRERSCRVRQSCDDLPVETRSSYPSRSPESASRRPGYRLVLPAKPVAGRSEGP